MPYVGNVLHGGHPKQTLRDPYTTQAPTPKEAGALHLHLRGREDPLLRKKCALGLMPRVTNPPLKIASKRSRVSTAGSKLAARALCPTAARSPWPWPSATGGVAFTHQTVGLCQSSKHWANSLRSAAGALPTETKRTRYH